MSIVAECFCLPAEIAMQSTSIFSGVSVLDRVGQQLICTVRSSRRKWCSRSNANEQYSNQAMVVIYKYRKLFRSNAYMPPCKQSMPLLGRLGDFSCDVRLSDYDSQRTSTMPKKPPATPETIPPTAPRTLLIVAQASRNSLARTKIQVESMDTYLKDLQSRAWR